MRGGRDRTRTCDLLRVKPNPSLQPLIPIGSFGFSTIWGVCFRSADNLKQLNQFRSDTVLIRKTQQ